MNLKHLLISLLSVSTLPDLTSAVPITQKLQNTLLFYQQQFQQQSWLDTIAQNSPAFIGNYLASKDIKAKDVSFTSFKSSSSQDVITDGVYSTVSIPRNDFDEWLIVQQNIAFNGILNNIGGVGKFDDSDDVTVGAVIASPSKHRPNYFYQWTRDAAITMQSLIEQLDDSNFGYGQNLSDIVESYIYNSYNLQRVSNPTGDFKSLDGLGEPKFMANSTAFLENWGRPQRDGPGLRVITICNYLNLLHEHNKQINHPQLTESFIYNEILKPDLLYIVKSWYKSGFDLWEEIDSLHLFTSLTQLKALKLGLELAHQYEDKDFYNDLARTFNALRYFILADSGYKSTSLPYLIETPSLLASGKRSGLDIASILASLRSHDITNEDDTLDIPFPIDDASVLNTLTAMVNDMKYRYPINHNRLGFGVGFALGRYPEDIYDGYGTSEGNPWFISTATASELIYKLIYNLYSREKSIEIPIEQSSLFESITNLKLKDEVTILPFNSKAFKTASLSLLTYGDTFLDIIRQHVDNDGHMSEQFNKHSGFMEGAEELTWSYGAFWSSLRWRNKAIRIMNEHEGVEQPAAAVTFTNSLKKHYYSYKL